MIISTGIATISELEETVKTAKEFGCKDLTLLKCTSAYPADPKEINLKTIPHLRELFDVNVGLSDHTMGIGVSIAAVALGATVIEKHFTLKRSDGGVDSAFSLEPHEMKMLVQESKVAWEALGKVHYGLTEKESDSRKFRRSIYAVKDIEAGEEFSPENIKCIRPGFGLPPRYFEFLIGKKAKHQIGKGSPLNFNLI